MNAARPIVVEKETVMKLAMPLVLGLALVLTSAPAGASALFASPAVTPISPTAATPVVAHLLVYQCAAPPEVSVVRAENVIELLYQDAGCPIDPIPPQAIDVDLGVLSAGVYDLRILAVDQPADAQLQDESILQVAAAPCAEDALCLLAGRIEITATWTDYAGHTGVAHPVPLSDETGAFWFFDDQNLELMVKALDGCALDEHRWLFAGGLTDVQVTLRARDLRTGGERVYTNALGHSFALVRDVGAFLCDDGARRRPDRG